ncbi:MAG TPA: L-threonylcarbamoyladenylate synthase, partial [Paludibacter sp.]|nr:L-threonylcarbamoyladenylate synthase [Paludibacter sp.]
DTVYAFGCDIFNTRAVETIVRLKNKDARKPNLSFVCHEMNQISEYAKMDDAAFKLMKKNLPGPFTFLLRGNNRLPKLFKNKKEVGIRIPDNNIAISIVRELGNPLMVSSVFRDEDVPEYATDPELIHEKFGSQVDLIIDGGMGGIEPSTVVDCTESGEYVIVRQGVKELRE